jgi:neurotransmitter:Na+ symporter, NSS family
MVRARVALPLHGHVLYWLLLTLGITAVLTALGSLWVLYFSQGLAALDTMDFWVGTVAIFVLAGVEVVCFGWVYGVDRGLAEAH